jgi:RimJ/RimL family protein N-acetyltransferase
MDPATDTASQHLTPSLPLPEVPESISSERLTIRCPRLADVPRIVAAVHESLDELEPWMRWATRDYSLEACEANTRQAIAQFITRENLRYHFHDPDSGELIGSSGLHRINWQVPRFEIGYWVRTSQAGKGYVSETVRALSRMAFETLDAKRVEIRCDDLNLASARVAERCGFELNGVLSNWKRAHDGTLRHERVYAMIDPARLR